MALQKVDYVNQVTVITAENMNAIQDAIIALETAPSQGLSEDVKQALLQLAQKVAYIDAGGQTYYDDLYNALYPPKSLVSIEAVFDQGSAVIYDNASLDTLKTMLTVTAQYDDNTTEILPDSAYTLSGLLEAGTSTVTVAYNGLTTTFTVNVTARPTLSSISAVYTQSGTVQDTDTLDSLKSDLVVTAHYSDSSTQTVPAADYTLSGTLAVGASTITVSYGGKTTTFSVTVSESPDVPSDYTQYDYIAYIGANTNVVKNNIIYTATYANLNDLVIEYEWSPLLARTSATAILGGQSTSGNTNNISFYGRTDTKRVSAFSHGTAIGIDNNTGVAVGNVVSVKLDPGSESPSTLSVDDVDQTGAWANQNTINAPIGYCGTYGTHATNVSMYYFAGIGILKLSDLSGNLVGKYIPVKRKADNVLGIYDTVEQVFHTAGNLALVTEGGASCVWEVGNWEA